MYAFVVRRTIAAIPVLGMVALFVFFMLRMTPGDPAAVLAGDNGTPAQIAEIRESLGLNEPIPTQMAIWFGDLLRGDLGQSYFFKKDVTELILLRVEPTLALAAATLALSVLIAVPIGVVAAWKRGTWIDRGVMGFSVMGFSVPVFVVGYILIYVFAMQLKLFPVQGYKEISDGFLRFIHRLILPAATLSVIYIALIARIARASVLEVLGEDYIRTARAKGLTERAVLLRHALRNAAVPIVTVIGIGVALLASAVLLAASRERSFAKILAPPDASRSAMALPMPPPAPVTIATRPSSFMPDSLFAMCA